VKANYLKPQLSPRTTAHPLQAQLRTKAGVGQQQHPSNAMQEMRGVRDAGRSDRRCQARRQGARPNTQGPRHDQAGGWMGWLKASPDADLGKAGRPPFFLFISDDIWPRFIRGSWSALLGAFRSPLFETSAGSARAVFFFFFFFFFLLARRGVFLCYQSSICFCSAGPGGHPVAQTVTKAEAWRVRGAVGQKPRVRADVLGLEEGPQVRGRRSCVIRLVCAPLAHSVPERAPRNKAITEIQKARLFLFLA